MSRLRHLVVAVVVLAMTGCTGSNEPTAEASGSAAASAAPAAESFASPPLRPPPPLPSPPPGLIEPGGGSLQAGNQEGDGSQVVVQEVVAPRAGGFVAVRADESGAPGRVLGALHVPGGLAPMSVVVPLDRAITRSGPLWVVLHDDTGVAGTFEFPGGDPPSASSSQPVSARVSYTVTSG